MCTYRQQAQHWNGEGNGKSWNLRGHLIVGFKDGNMLLSRKFKASANNFSVQLEVDRNTEGQTELMAHVGPAFIVPPFSLVSLSLSS